MHAYHLQRFYNENLWKVSAMLLRGLFQPLSLSPCNCIQEVFARMPLFFTGLISLPWQRNDSCYWSRCVCVCAGVCVVDGVAIDQCQLQ